MLIQSPIPAHHRKAAARQVGPLTRDRTPLRGRVAEVFGSLERGMDRLKDMLTPKKKAPPTGPRTAKVLRYIIQN